MPTTNDDFDGSEADPGLTREDGALRLFRRRPNDEFVEFVHVDVDPFVRGELADA